MARILAKKTLLESAAHDVTDGGICTDLPLYVIFLEAAKGGLEGGDGMVGVEYRSYT